MVVVEENRSWWSSERWCRIGKTLLGGRGDGRLTHERKRGRLSIKGDFVGPE